MQHLPAIKKVTTITDINCHAHKGEVPLVFYRKAIHKIEQQATKKNVIKNGIVPSPQVNLTLSQFFHFSKEESREFLDELELAGLVKVVPYHGIRIN